MNETRVHADVTAALMRLQKEQPQLKEELKNSWGFAVFPSVGRASVLLGGAYGHGEVFEQGRSIGFATVSQISLGVQVGGQTFTMVVIFPKKEALDEFRTGKVAFTANASGVIVKAAASGTTDFNGVTAHAYSHGGMLLEASLGGQKFMFIPPTRGLSEHQEQQQQWAFDDADEEKEQEQGQEAAGEGDDAKQEAAQEGNGGSEERSSKESEQEGDGGSEERTSKEASEKNGESDEGGGLRKLGDKLMGKIRQVGGKLPVLKKEAEASERLHAEAAAALERMKAKDESLEEALDDAYAFAIFPSVGKASLVLGGTYGKGEVFRDGKLVGYGGVIQLTIGLQVGGQTFSELVLFQDEEAFKRFKAGKIGFAANASAVIVKGGAAATNNYKQGMQIFVHTDGGLAGELSIGGQKLIYRPAGLTRRKRLDQDTGEELGHSKPADELPARV